MEICVSSVAFFVIIIQRTALIFARRRLLLFNQQACMSKQFPLFKRADLRSEAGFSEIIDALQNKIKDLGDSDVVKTIKNLPSDMYENLFGDDYKSDIKPPSDTHGASKYYQEILSERVKEKPNGKAIRLVDMNVVAVDPTNFYRAVLARIGAPATSENLKFFTAWRKSEGGKAAFNPFNTTMPRPGATNYGPAGEKNYISEEQGVEATAATLQKGYYTAIVAALRRGDNAEEAAEALAKSPWGTKDLALKVLRGWRKMTGVPSVPMYYLPEKS